MKLARKVGATSQILQIFIADSSSTTGAGLTGLTNASAGLTAYYHRDTDTTATAISLVTMTVGTFTSSGFKEIDATNMPGWYQFCPPNAALASGAASVGIHLKGATNMAPLPIEIDLDAQVDVTLWNGTAVASPATAGIPDINVKNINNVAAATPGATGGVLIAGSNAATTFTGGITVTQSSLNTPAISITGNGTGAGIAVTGGATAPGINASGGASGGAGLVAQAAGGNANGITAIGNGTGDGFAPTGGSTGNGIHAVSGTGATGDGILAVAASTNGNGVTATHAGSGKDLNATTTPLIVASVAGAVGSVTGAVGSVTGAVGSVTGNVGGNVAGSVAGSVGSVTAAVTLTSAYDFAKGTTAMTESYAALHAAPTPVQILYEMRSLLAENSVATTTVTTKKIDGATTAETFTLDSATTPTSITRAS